MKKIYSLLLTAAALLVGTNAWAGTYNVGTAEQFEAAWQKSATEDVIINLTSDEISLSKTLWLGTQNLTGEYSTPHTVEINLNGYPLTSTVAATSKVSAYAFMLTRGTLKFSGSGSVNVPSATNVFYVTGSANEDVNPKNDGANYFTHLEIGEGVIINHGYYDAAITVDGLWKGGTAHKENTGYLPSKPALGYITNVYAGKNSSYPTDAKAETNSSKCVANGVRIDLKGQIAGRKYGIKTNGILGNPTWYEKQSYANTDHTIAFTSSLVPAGYVIDSADIDYSPFVHIYPTGRITVQASDDVHAGTTADPYKNPIGVYASGYARWKVEGYVAGCNGAVVKSGEVDFNNATVVGTGSTYQSASESSSGSDASGSAIVITSSAAYSGDIDVSISGDSYVTAQHGYAIDESVVAADSTTKVNTIEITGGTFVGGSIQSDPTDPASTITDCIMNVSLPTAIAAANTDTITTITIIGGNAIANTGDTITATIGGQTLEQFLANQATEDPSSKTHITYVDDGQGGTTMVISQGTAPTAVELGVASWQNGQAINWKHTLEGDDASMEDVVGLSTLGSENKKLTLAELQISQNFDQQLTIEDGYTLEVGRVIMGPKAKIIVEAGGKFIVSGGQGIVAPKAENIVLKHNSNTGKYATFLFNPAVTSNKHPNAIVEFTTNSWWQDNNNLQWEWFGIPTYTTAKSISSKAGNDAVYASVEVFENNDWTDLGYIGGDYDNNPAVLAKLDKPFAAYDLLAYRAFGDAAPTITISGELVGNVNAPLNANMKWNPFANSYTAEIDAPALVSALSASENIAHAIWVATQNTNGTITWDAKPANKLVNQYKTLKPMQAFMLNNNRYVEETAINYVSMVYNPATIPANNPAPRRSVAENTMVTINVANENGTWDDVDLCENNEDSYEKYMNSDINIYVAEGEKIDYFATDDLENTYVGFSTVKGGNFTISFAKAEGREFDLIDLETGARFAVSEGETYSFSAAANSANDYRFKLVAPAKMPTAIENTEVKANVKGIFTLTGQYLGEMNVWNTLPAGVYVVNGAKLVK